MAFTDDIPPLDDFPVHDFLFRKLPSNRENDDEPWDVVFSLLNFSDKHKYMIYIYVVGYIACGNPHKIYNQRWFASSSLPSNDVRWVAVGGLATPWRRDADGAARWTPALLEHRKSHGAGGAWHRRKSEVAWSGGWSQGWWMKVSNSQCHLSHVLVLGSLGIFGEVLGRF